MTLQKIWRCGEAGEKWGCNLQGTSHLLAMVSECPCWRPPVLAAHVNGITKARISNSDTFCIYLYDYVICPSVRLRNWLPRDLRNSRRMRETLGANPDLGSGWCVSAISRGGDGFEFLFCDFMGFTSWNFFPNLQFWSADMEYHCNFCCVETNWPFISFHQTFPHVFHYFGWCETLKNAKMMTCPKMMQDGYGGDTKFHPWRYPGKAPVKDACGVTAGGTAPLGQLDPPPGETTGAAGKTLPPLLEETVWIAGSEVEAKKRDWKALNDVEWQTNWYKLTKKQHLTWKIIGMVSQYGYWFITRMIFGDHHTHSNIFWMNIPDASETAERSLGALLQIMVVATSIAFVLLTQIQLKNVFKKLLWTLLVKILGVPDISHLTHFDTSFHELHMGNVFADSQCDVGIL